MSGNSGAWGIAMWQDGYSTVLLPEQEQGISLEGGDPVLPYLPTDPVGTLLVPPDGLGVPPVRSDDVAFAQRDGVVQFADYYEPRQITLQVLVKNDGCPGCPGARQKVARLTQEWSRSCSGATLVLFTDCHNPDATEEEKVYLGPYLVHGRPRVADVVWDRSNRGTARVTLRFDAADARLVLADTIPGTFWTTEHVQTLDADEQNLIPDPDLSSFSMTANGATVDDSVVLQGGPSGEDGGPFFRRIVETLPASSPMTGVLSGTGTSGIPVTAGLTYSWAWWARKDPSGGIPQTRLDYTWYTAAGAVITVHNGAGYAVTSDWARYSQSAVAPATAAFVQPRLIWTGIPGTPNYTLDLAQAWMNAGAAATEPETVEVVGTLCVYPVISLFPEMTAPIVVTYGNHQFTYTEDVPTGTVVEISTQWGRASDGFEDVTANLEGDYSSPIEPGVHDVTVQTGDPTDTGFVNIVWENAVVAG